jgi:hypothetical protein
MAIAHPVQQADIKSFAVEDCIYPNCILNLPEVVFRRSCLYRNERSAHVLEIVTLTVKDNKTTMESQKHHHGMSNFLAGVAVALSTLACLIGGFAVYKISSLEQEIGDLSRTAANSTTAQTGQIQENTGGGTPSQSTVPTPSETPASPVNNADIQPGQFIQFAFGNKAQVELLTVKRIKNPETGTRDAVNVQFRARRLASDEESIGSDKFTLFADQTTARNPDTSETYKSPNSQHSTGLIGLYRIKKGASVDAYVWLKVPEGTNTLDIYVPETQVFKNVPITN